MAELLVEIKAAVEQAVAGGESQLGEEERRKFERRYEDLVRRGLELNPERTRRRSVTVGGGVRAGRGRVAQTAARKLVARLERRRAEVLRFMTDFEVPFENNQAERDLRMVKLQQKVSGCFRTGEGAREFCRVRGLISTARKQGQGVLAALEQVLRGQQLSLTS
jgi:transposase